MASLKKPVINFLDTLGVGLRPMTDPLNTHFGNNSKHLVVWRSKGVPKAAKTIAQGRVPESIVQRILDFFAQIDPFYENKNPPQPLQIAGAWRNLLQETRQSQLQAIARKDHEKYRGLLENMFFNELHTGLRNFGIARAGEALNYDFLIECDAFECLSDRPRSDMAIKQFYAMAGLQTERGIVRYTDPQHGGQACHILRLLDFSAESGKPATVLDIGSGFGGLAEKLIGWAERDMRVYLIDIPLNITTAYAYLAASFGEDSAVLVSDPLALKNIDKDVKFVCVPTLFAEDLAHAVSFDVVHNAKSFSEMDQPTAQYYIDTFVGKDVEWFVHTNSNRKGSQNYGAHTEVIAHDLSVPSTHKLLSRFPDSRPGRYVFSIYKKI